MSLEEKFRARFVATATERLARVARTLETRRGDPALDEVASELHALSGEASLLGAAEIADLSREAERAARTRQPVELQRVLGRLEVAVFAHEIGGGGT